MGLLTNKQDSIAPPSHRNRNVGSQATARKRFQKQLRFEQLEDRRLLASVVIPNDPGFSSQWPLHNTGQTGGTPDADIDMPAAWTVSTGSMSTIVAVLDTGVDYTNPDLYLNIWINENEIQPGLRASLTDADSDGLISFRDFNHSSNAAYVTDFNSNGYIDGGDLLNDIRWENGVDDDNNGRVDDLIGWDFQDNDNDPQATNSSHGTEKALHIGAVGNNGIGGAGIAWSVRLMPVRIQALGGAETTMVNANAASGIDYAVSSGASISNNSWRANPPDVFSQEIYDAIARAQQANHLFVTAAGNGASNSDAYPWYPGAYNFDNIITAAAVDENNQLSSLSNWGAVNIDIGVPSYGGATSNSAALTSGVAALLKSSHADWTYAQIKNQILSTVDLLPSLTGKTVTGGRLNAANALGVPEILTPTKFYVVNDGSPDRTYEYGATGSAIENYSINSGNTSPRGAASNAAGDTVWVADKNRKVYVYNTSGGLLGSWSAGTLASTATVEGIATNGTDVWIVDSKSDKVFRYTGAATRTSGSQNAASSFSLNTSNKSAKGIVTDGTYLWVVNSATTDKVFKYTISGSLVGSWTIDSANKTPTGLTIDPTGASQSIWIVDSGTDKVYEYTNARGKTSGSQSAAVVFALATGNTNPQGIADPPPASAQLPLATASLSPAALSLAADFDESTPLVTAFDGAVLRTSDSRRDERASRVDGVLAMPGSPKLAIRDSSVSVITPATLERAARSSKDDAREAFDEAFLDVLAEADLARYASVFEN